MGGRGAEGADAPDEAAIRRIFASLEQGWEAGFLDAVRPDVRWEVLGSHPLAGDYRGVDAFVAGTSAALAPYLEAGVQLSVVGVLVKGRTAVVELVDHFGLKQRQQARRRLVELRAAEHERTEQAAQVLLPRVGGGVADRSRRCRGRRARG